MSDRRISIRSPIARFVEASANTSVRLERPLSGLRVGLRKDRLWKSWITTCELWSDWLRRDGAEAIVLEVGEHVGEEGLRTNERLRAWADTLDCAVVGLAN